MLTGMDKAVQPIRDFFPLSTHPISPPAPLREGWARSVRDRGRITPPNAGDGRLGCNGPRPQRYVGPGCQIWTLVTGTRSSLIKAASAFDNRIDPHPLQSRLMRMDPVRTCTCYNQYPFNSGQISSICELSQSTLTRIMCIVWM